MIKFSWRIFWISVISLIILLTPLWIYICYFHSNDISSEPEKWGPFGDFIGGILNPVVSLLTLIATIIIAFIIKRIDDRNRMEDRAASYQPQLVVEQSSFYTYLGTKYDSKKTVEYSYTSKGWSYKSDLQLPNIFGLNIFNIGLGPARNVKFTFEIDTAQITQLISEKSNIFPVDKVIRAIHQAMPVAGMVRYEYPASWNIGPFQIVEILNKPSTVSHILNVNVSNKPFFLEIPKFFLELYTIYQYIWFQQLQIDANNLPEFIPILLKATYQDIGKFLISKEYKKDYKVILKSLLGGFGEFTNLIEVQEI